MSEEINDTSCQLKGSLLYIGLAFFVATCPDKEYEPFLLYIQIQGAKKQGYKTYCNLLFKVLYL